MTTTLRDTPRTLERDERAAPCWSLHVVHHPSAAVVGRRRVLLPGVSIALCRDGDALGPAGLGDPRMSRRHCQLEVTAQNALVLRDLGSSNGTWVNGVSVSRRELDVDDVVRVGSVLLAVQRTPPTWQPVVDAHLVAAGWALARVLAELAATPSEQRLIALHGEASTGIDDVARWLADREAMPLVRSTTLAPAAEGHVTLLGPLPCPDAATRAALVRATPARGRLVLWVEGRTGEREAELDAALSTLTPATWRVPPLRERMVDLPLLVERLSAATHGRPARLHHRLMMSLLRSPWPGNLRQLGDLVRAHLAPAGDDEPLRWSEPVVGALAAQAYLERSAAGEDSPRPAPATAVYRVALDGRWFELPDGARVQVHPRRALSLLLGALAAHHLVGSGDALSTERLVAAGWPGERPVGLSGAGRVYVALSTLRKLGLRDVIERHDDGYRLGGARVEVVDP